jgi:hypothetical protein
MNRILVNTGLMVQMVVVCRQLLQEVHKSYRQGDMGNCQWHIPA